MNPRLLAAFLVAVCCDPVPSRAVEGTKDYTFKDPPTYATEVIGDIPVDLRGVWLIVSQGKLGASPKFHNALELEAIRQKDGKLDAELLLRELPQDIKDDLERANKEGRSWAPSPEQLAQLRDGLEGLKPTDPLEYFRHTVRIVGASKYDAALKPAVAALVPESAFSLEIEHAYRPREQEENARQTQMMADKAIYGVVQSSPTMLEGEHTRTLLAAGYIPVPINLKGPFWMHRLRGPDEIPPPTSASSSSWRDFLSGLFRGCR